MFLNFKGEVFSKDGCCTDNNRLYICEKNEAQEILYTSDDQEINRFMKKLTEENINNEKNVEIYLNRDNVKISLLEAQLICKIFGLQFFAKDVELRSFEELEPLKNFVCFRVEDPSLLLGRNLY